MNSATTPEEVPKLFVENWNKRRPDLMAELFEENADFINVVGLWWHNRKDIFKAHDYGLRVIFKDSFLEIISLKTKTLSNEFAIIHAKMKLSGQSSIENQKANIRRTIFTFVVRKTTIDNWLAVSAQNTDIVGGAETYIRTENGEFKPVNYQGK
ncbi:MAG: SgcJ/EcaC family oxidoreductase [Bacteroidia bacterium]|nr:SgcJ/EcaC family oxidoreductase [Bacteroidia bacterium]MCC7534426.1 SgcJ/EcaC family oxidoreductase [Bacteroidia bacterium]MCZ2248296.1 SgcJ/EcaC family oxidoreductase [Bacteroidia bacterium]